MWNKRLIVDCLTGEETIESYEIPDPTPEEIAAELESIRIDGVRQQIASLESQITVRRTREAILGTDNGWLANIDSQIAALRAQL